MGGNPDTREIARRTDSPGVIRHQDNRWPDTAWKRERGGTCGSECKHPGQGDSPEIGFPVANRNSVHHWTAFMLPVADLKRGCLGNSPNIRLRKITKW